jgi:hypothetical protein
MTRREVPLFVGWLLVGCAVGAGAGALMVGGTAAAGVGAGLGLALAYGVWRVTDYEPYA